MLKILMNSETHISGLAKELGISVPVALKHTKILEGFGLIERHRIGSTHVLRIKKEAVSKVKQAWNLFEKPLIVKVPRGTPMLEALKKVSGLEINEKSGDAYITSVDGKQGYYIYEVNGRLTDKPADKLKIEKGIEVELKRLMPVIGKKILIKVE